MPGWDEIMAEINNTPNNIDYVRRNYLCILSEYTNRDTIAYYSGWLENPQAHNVDINDSDMEGFMNVIKGLECNKGLDLILHTPGGSPEAAEAIVHYIRKKFNNDVRIIVPQLAMSAGTMIACSGKSIIMGKHSSLGPIDPQFNGIPCYNIKDEFQKAKEELSNTQDNIAYWSILLNRYPPAFLKTALDAIELSSLLVREWLESCMFSGDQEKDEKIEHIVQCLNEHNNSKLHGRHFSIDYCKDIGLKIEEMEENKQLQDLILSVHHSYIATLNMGNVVKIIESSNGKAYINILQK